MYKYRQQLLLRSHSQSIKTTPASRQHHAFAFRYINKSTTIYLAVRPRPSSRDFQFYTRYIPEISRETNLLYGWTDAHPSAYEIDERCNVIECNVTTARIIADTIQIPLVVSMREYCNIDDGAHVEEVYYYRRRQS